MVCPINTCTTCFTISFKAYRAYYIPKKASTRQIDERKTPPKWQLASITSHMLSCHAMNGNSEDDAVQTLGNQNDPVDDIASTGHPTHVSIENLVPNGDDANHAVQTLGNQNDPVDDIASTAHPTDVSIENLVPNGDDSNDHSVPPGNQVEDTTGNNRSTNASTSSEQRNEIDSQKIVGQSTGKRTRKKRVFVDNTSTKQKKKKRK